MRFQMRLWAVVLGCLALPNFQAAAENADGEEWYDASGEVVKRVKQVGKELPGNRDSMDWAPAWVVRERVAVRKSWRRNKYISSRSGYGQTWFRWYASRCQLGTRMGSAGIYAASMILPRKEIRVQVLRCPFTPFFR